MRNNETPDDALDRLEADSNDEEPFRSSRAGESYEPSGNWGTERRLDQPATGNAPHGMEGAASGAGYGGFGPEGDYSGPGGDPNADIAGQVNADRDRLVEEAQAEGPVRPGRAFTSNRSAADEGKASDREHQADTRLSPNREDAADAARRDDRDRSA